MSTTPSTLAELTASLNQVQLLLGSITAEVKILAAGIAVLVEEEENEDDNELNYLDVDPWSNVNEKEQRVLAALAKRNDSVRSLLQRKPSTFKDETKVLARIMSQKRTTTDTLSEISEKSSSPLSSLVSSPLSSSSMSTSSQGAATGSEEDGIPHTITVETRNIQKHSIAVSKPMTSPRSATPPISTSVSQLAISTNPMSSSTLPNNNSSGSNNTSSSILKNGNNNNHGHSNSVSSLSSAFNNLSNNSSHTSNNNTPPHFWRSSTQPTLSQTGENNHGSRPVSFYGARSISHDENGANGVNGASAAAAIAAGSYSAVGTIGTSTYTVEALSKPAGRPTVLGGGIVGGYQGQQSQRPVSASFKNGAGTSPTIFHQGMGRDISISQPTAQGNNTGNNTVNLKGGPSYQQQQQQQQQQPPPQPLQALRIDQTEPVDCFSKLSLRPELLRGIYAYGLKMPSFLQQRGIPIILSKQDVLAQARPEIAKTLTYVIPLLQRLTLPATSIHPQVLILCSNHDLCLHVQRVLLALARFMPTISCLICADGSQATISHGTMSTTKVNLKSGSGAPPTSSQQQNRHSLYGKSQYQSTPEIGLSSGGPVIPIAAHVVIGTPTKVLSLLRSKQISGVGLKSLVLENADILLLPPLKDATISLLAMIRDPPTNGNNSATASGALSPVNGTGSTLGSNVNNNSGPMSPVSMVVASLNKHALEASMSSVSSSSSSSSPTPTNNTSAMTQYIFLSTDVPTHVREISVLYMTVPTTALIRSHDVAFKGVLNYYKYLPATTTTATSTTLSTAGMSTDVVDEEWRLDLLMDLLQDSRAARAMVFCTRSRSVEKILQRLNSNGNGGMTNLSSSRLSSSLPATSPISSRVSSGATTTSGSSGSPPFSSSYNGFRGAVFAITGDMDLAQKRNMLTKFSTSTVFPTYLVARDEDVLSSISSGGGGGSSNTTIEPVGLVPLVISYEISTKVHPFSNYLWRVKWIDRSNGKVGIKVSFVDGGSSSSSTGMGSTGTLQSSSPAAGTSEIQLLKSIQKNYRITIDDMPLSISDLITN